MKILKNQLWHLISLSIMLLLLYLLSTNYNTMLNGELWGITTSNWFLIAILSPIIHQLYVLICWRLELYFKSMSKIFGKYAFYIYKAGFGLLIASRLITITILAMASSQTLNISTDIAYIIVGILAIPAIYLFYSVFRYFGIDRAYGIDHFEPEKAKEKEFVKKGIFRFTSNGMYIYGFFLLWIPGFLFQSEAALVIAFFNHIYIWVHFYCTELPDMKYIYK